MRNAPILLTLAALAACDPEAAPPPEAGNRPGAATLTGPETADALPPAPPVWRPDPAIDTRAAMLDSVPDDPVRGVPSPLRGLRVSAWAGSATRHLVKSLGHTGWASPALSREDFRRGSRECLEDLLEYRGANLLLERGTYQSAEEQTHWYASLRAKEAVYGAGAEEAVCERVLLEHALLVARGEWRRVFDRSKGREKILEEWADFARAAKEWGWEYEEPAADPEAAARLELWLKCDDEKCMGRYVWKPSGGGAGGGGPGLCGGEPDGGGGASGGNDPSEQWECDKYIRCPGQGGEGDGVPCDPECPPIGADCWAEWKCVRIM